MNKRERILGLLETDGPWDYVPAGFFIHFPEQYHYGQAAVAKHLEYFRYTGMDFVKIQFENRFPDRPEIRQPADWANMPQYGPEFYENQLANNNLGFLDLIYFFFFIAVIAILLAFLVLFGLATFCTLCRSN